MAIAISSGTSCAVDGVAQTDGIASAWQRRDAASVAQITPKQQRLIDRTPRQISPANRTANDNQALPVSNNHDTIATVNGQNIKRSQVVDLLLRAHGPSLLNQLVVYDRARSLAADRGLSLSSVDVEREYARTLNRLANPLAAIAPNQADRQDAEVLLTEVLSKKNISRQEYDLTIRRNALLRKLVSHGLHFTEAQIKAEHALMIGRKAEVRHIQVATHAELSRVLDRLGSGEDFAEVARRYSSNTASAQSGGLLLPFAEQDDHVPDLLRKTAFDLQPGQLADPIRMGAWYHVIKLERIVPAKSTPYDLVKDEIEDRLRDRLAEPAMQQLSAKLLREAQIEIHDPLLRQAYEQAGGKQSP